MTLHARMRRQVPGALEELQKLLASLATMDQTERSELWGQVVQQAHRLRGRAAMLELASLSSAAAQLERHAAKGRDPMAAQALLDACMRAASIDHDH